jgi:hypothetical protein
MKSKCEIFVSFRAFHSVRFSQFFVEIISGFSQAAYTHITPNHLLFTSAFPREPGSEDFYTSPSCKFTRYSLDVRRCALRIITKRLSCIFFLFIHTDKHSQDNRSICVPLAAFAKRPNHKNQQRTQCTSHVTQCGAPGA